MTDPIRKGADPALDAMLDRFTVPAHTPDLASRIAAAALTRHEVSTVPTPAHPRDRRGPWARSRRAVIGVAAFGLMSATAAAAGLFGEMPVRIPVITAFVERVAEVTKPTPKPPAPPKQAKKTAPSPAAEPQVTLPPIPAPEELVLTPEQRRAARAEKLADKLEQRIAENDARRAARGLPPKSEQQRAMLEKLRTAKTDAERRALLQEARATAEARRAERARKMGIDPAILPDRPKMRRMLTPEERQARRQMYREKRDQRLEELRRLKDVDPATLRNETAPVPAPTE